MLHDNFIILYELLYFFWFLIDSCYTYAYRKEIADKRILKNRIVYLFDEIIADEINRYDSCGDDPDLAQNMFNNYLNLLKNTILIFLAKDNKNHLHRLEEIREIDNSNIILGYSPEKILEGFLIKLAEFYDYKLSPNFLEKYEKELPHSPSYYENDYQFYRNRKKNYF